MPVGPNKELVMDGVVRAHTKASGFGVSAPGLVATDM